MKIQLLTHARKAYNGFRSILLSFSFTLQNYACSLHKNGKEDENTQVQKEKNPPSSHSLSEAITVASWGYFLPSLFFFLHILNIVDINTEFT